MVRIEPDLARDRARRLHTVSLALPLSGVTKLGSWTLFVLVPWFGMRFWTRGSLVLAQLAGCLAPVVTGFAIGGYGGFLIFAAPFTGNEREQAQQQRDCAR